MMAVAVQAHTCLVAKYTADKQLSPVLKSAGNACHQQAWCPVSLLCFLLKGLLAKCTVAVACNSAQATFSFRLDEAIRCLLYFVQDSYPFSDAPMCCTGFPFRQAALRAVVRKSRDVMRSKRSTQVAGDSLYCFENSRICLCTRRC